MDKISLFEAFYILYMFLFFKTKYSIHHPLEIYVTGYHHSLLHPINTQNYESKICPFGKNIILLLFIFLIYRSYYIVPKIYSKLVLFVTILLSTMNMNALVYLLPYYIIELYRLHL
tara:strand:+ start:326 stop:673 length:348 start_codon:yes stop_codon:yes gene_type:complete